MKKRKTPDRQPTLAQCIKCRAVRSTNISQCMICGSVDYQVIKDLEPAQYEPLRGQGELFDTEEQ